MLYLFLTFIFSGQIQTIHIQNSPFDSALRHPILLASGKVIYSKWNQAQRKSFLYIRHQDGKLEEKAGFPNNLISGQVRSVAGGIFVGLFDLDTKKHQLQIFDTSLNLISKIDTSGAFEERSVFISSSETIVGIQNYQTKTGELLFFDSQDQLVRSISSPDGMEVFYKPVRLGNGNLLVATLQRHGGSNWHKSSTLYLLDAKGTVIISQEMALMRDLVVLEEDVLILTELGGQALHTTFSRENGELKFGPKIVKSDCRLRLSEDQSLFGVCRDGVIQKYNSKGEIDLVVDIGEWPKEIVKTTEYIFITSSLGNLFVLDLQGILLDRFVLRENSQLYWNALTAINSNTVLISEEYYDNRRVMELKYESEGTSTFKNKTAPLLLNR